VVNLSPRYRAMSMLGAPLRDTSKSTSCCMKAGAGGTRRVQKEGGGGGGWRGAWRSGGWDNASNGATGAPGKVGAGSDEESWSA
jgi:hypothetical protein